MQFALGAMGALLALGVFAQGGFFPNQAMIFAAGLVLLAIFTSRLDLPELRVPFLAFGSLAAGILLSSVVNSWPEGTGVAVAALATAASAFLIARTLILGGHRSDLLEVLGWIGAAAAAIGLLGVTFHAEPWAMKATGIWRAAGPLTYANAFGALLVLTLPAPLILSRSRAGSTNRLMIYLILAGIVASVSRGAAGSLVVAAIVLLALGGKQAAPAAGRPLLGALVAGIGLIPSISGNSGAPIPALAGMALGAAIAVFPRGGSVYLNPGRRRVAVLAVAVLPVALLMASSSGLSVPTSRLSLESENRFEVWSAVLKTSQETPLFGTGLGTLRIAFTIDDRAKGTLFAHNEPLQALAETGVVGLLSVLVAIGLLAGWILRARPRGDERTIWAAGVAACAAFVVQGMSDFTWHFPVVVALAFLWVAVATIRPGSEGEGEI